MFSCSSSLGLDWFQFLFSFPFFLLSRMAQEEDDGGVMEVPEGARVAHRMAARWR